MPKRLFGSRVPGEAEFSADVGTYTVLILAGDPKVLRAYGY